MESAGDIDPWSPWMDATMLHGAMGSWIPCTTQISGTVDFMQSKNFWDLLCCAADYVWLQLFLFAVD